MASGSITHNIAATLHTETGERSVSMAEERKGSNALVARPALGIVPAADQAGDKPIGRAVAKLTGPVAVLAAGKLIVLAAVKLIVLAVGRLIDPAVAKLIGPAAVELRVQAVAEIGLVAALYPRVQEAEAAMP